MCQDTPNLPSPSDVFQTLKNSSLESTIRGICLAGLLGFIFFNRVRNYANIKRADGSISFPSVDGWYHRRATIYTIENYPHTLNFDPYSGFDVGNQVGQFGTIFDWFLATVALLIGGGDPSTTTVDTILAFVPPLFAVATGAIIYILGARITTRWGGIAAVSILALTPGLFLSHSMVGFIDHHIAEVLLVALSLLCVVTFTQATRAHPTIFTSHVQHGPLSPPLKWSTLAGVINGIYLLVWPPGILYIAILGVFIVCTILLEYIKDAQQSTFCTGSGIMMLTTGLVVVPFLATQSFSATSTSLIQVSLPAAIGVGSIILGYTTRKANLRSVHKGVYLGVLLATTTVVVGLLYAIEPVILQFFIHHSGRVFWFIGGESGVQIAEATTLSNPFEFGFITYGFALFTAVIGCLWIGKDAITADTPRGELVLLFIYAVIMSSATISQPRFDYYLVLAVALCTAYTLYQTYTTVVQKLKTRNIKRPDLQSKVTITAITLLVLAPPLFSGAPVIAADGYTEPSTHNGWEQAFDWIETETPPFGAYHTESPNHVDYTGPFDNTEQFNYRSGQYGILSRWAIGHRITVETQRASVSNPHQQHSTVAANVLLAPSEETALQTLNTELDSGSGVQYIVLGRPWGSGNGRSFSAPTVSESAYGIAYADIGVPLYSHDGTYLRTLQNERSYQSLRTRLYQFHGSAESPSKYAIHSNTTIGSQDRVDNSEVEIREYSTPAAAAAVSNGDPNTIQGGIYGEPPAQINALQHFRLVHASEGTANAHPDTMKREHSGITDTPASAVKTFEKVQGASISGTASKNTTVKATVELQMQTTGTVFTYTQYADVEEDGSFEIVVPYATTGYEQYTPDGGFTNTSVRAKGPYEISTVGSSSNYSAQVAVSEGAVLGEEKFNRTIRLAHSE